MPEQVHHRETTYRAPQHFEQTVDFTDDVHFKGPIYLTLALQVKIAVALFLWAVVIVLVTLALADV